MTTSYSQQYHANIELRLYLLVVLDGCVHKGQARNFLQPWKEYTPMHVRNFGTVHAQNTTDINIFM